MGALSLPVIMRIIVGLTGVLLFIICFLAFCHKRMTENFTLAWLLFSLGLVLAGALPGFSAWSTVMQGKSFLAIYFLGCLVLFLLFTLSSKVSNLAMRNQELAMQVSLLNFENEKIIRALNELAGRDVLEDNGHGKEK